MQRRMRLDGQLSRLERVPDDPKPVDHPVAQLVKLHTCDFNPRHRHRMVCSSLQSRELHMIAHSLTRQGASRLAFVTCNWLQTPGGSNYACRIYTCLLSVFDGDGSPYPAQ